MKKLCVLMGCCTSLPVMAGPWGNDFGLSFNAVAGGLGASTYAMPYSASDSVFGNPASMTQFTANDVNISYGGAYANIDFTLEHDGTITGAPFSGKSDTVNFLIPNVAVVGGFSEGWFFGTGLNVTAGLGADFRTDTPLSPAISYIAFGNHFSAAKQLNEHWSIGASAVMGFGLMDIGPVQSGGTVNDIGFRVKLGTTYRTESSVWSAHYTSPMKFEFDNAFLTTGSEFGLLPVEQPAEFVLSVGVNATSDIDFHATIAHKRWGDADAYQDIWEDQTILMTGLQYKPGNIAYRLGLGYTNDIRDRKSVV